MKKLGFSILAVCMCFLTACNGDEPTDYSTIKGSWRCVETSSLSGTRTYSIDIYRLKSDTTNYLISNFHNVSFNEEECFVQVKLSGTTLSISPAPQSIAPTQIVVKSGAGIVDAARRQIVIDYLLFDGQSDSQVHVVYSR